VSNEYNKSGASSIDWDNLEPEIQQVIVQQAKDRLAFMRVRKKLYTNSAGLAAIVAILVGLREDILDFIVWLSNFLTGGK
jgi:hypothetical protein